MVCFVPGRSVIRVMCKGSPSALLVSLKVQYLVHFCSSLNIRCLDEVIFSHGFSYHYADDTQLILAVPTPDTFPLRSQHDRQAWMEAHQLKLNCCSLLFSFVHLVNPHVMILLPAWTTLWSLFWSLYVTMDNQLAFPSHVTNLTGPCPSERFVHFSPHRLLRYLLPCHFSHTTPILPHIRSLHWLPVAHASN